MFGHFPDDCLGESTPLGASSNQHRRLDLSDHLLQTILFGPPIILISPKLLFDLISYFIAQRLLNETVLINQPESGGGCALVHLAVKLDRISELAGDTESG